MPPRPASITANREQKELTVTWDDDHVSRYSFSLLRAGCPCAECQGGHENMSSLPHPDVFESDLPDSPATRLKSIVPVGSYAITPVWEDGHDYGIYQWGYLRALCPCEECRREREARRGRLSSL
jgi:DUF971 family protein